MISAIGWVAVVLLPGVAFAVAIAPALILRPVQLVAVAPAFSFAVSMAAAAALRVAGIGPWPWLVAVDGMVVLVAVVRLFKQRDALRHTPDPEPTPESAAGMADRRLARWLLGAAVVLGLGVWLVPGSPSVPSNRDVQNHGYFVARIANENSVDPAIVLAESPTNPEPVADFYPLAAHTTMATVHRATGESIPDLLVTWPLLAAVLTLPCGLFALTRRLLPDRPAAGGWAALAGACMALFPYQPMIWGGIAFTIGLSLVPGVLALALTAVDSPAKRSPTTRRSSHASRPSRSDSSFGPLVALAAAAVAGTALVHTSQLALLALVLGAFAVYDVASRRWTSPSPTPERPVANSAGAAPFARWAVLAGLCALLVSPAVAGVLAGAGERAAHEEVLTEGLGEVILRLVTLDINEGPSQLLMGSLAIAGIIVLVARRRSRPLQRTGALLAVMGVLALLFASLTLTGALWEPLRVATAPWYRSWWRLPYNLALFAPLFVGVALDSARKALGATDLLGRQPARAAGVVGAAFVAVSLPTILSALDDAGVRNEPLTAGQQAMFADLAQATSPGVDGRPAVVLNQENDGTAWAYITDGVPTFSGLQGFTHGAPRAQRQWLLEHADQVMIDPQVRTHFEQWNVRFVLVRDNTYQGEAAALEPKDFFGSEGFELVERQGSIWLFEVVT